MVEKVKCWLSAKLREEKQFSIVSVDSKGLIIQALRIKDNKFFVKDIQYPGVRTDYMVITEFKHDQVTVHVNNYTGDRMVGTGVFAIDDIIIQEDADGNCKYTDRLTERMLSSFTEAGINVQIVDSFTIKK